MKPKDILKSLESGNNSKKHLDLLVEPEVIYGMSFPTIINSSAIDNLLTEQYEVPREALARNIFRPIGGIFKRLFG